MRGVLSSTPSLPPTINPIVIIIIIIIINSSASRVFRQNLEFMLIARLCEERRGSDELRVYINKNETDEQNRMEI